ncbi:antibiotic biosynthesis monooxygenase [Mesorhizobium sp. B4-1-1]|uniref:putative quinol monooxygenase n=1 Tax=Mesorhizobium sp. B4-1-1 TaxID=2589890 RepID=UPI00112664E8|nr:antibiotic biosynthesis monooxygenase [Mesorhizobium sp. B4-1-1]TPI18348.1 antibiotic biosynthesis monooxygenase [Mesorhizobium sp. B4-1-1]
MNSITSGRDGVTLVNVLTCDPANQENLLSLLQANIDQVISTLDGWISTSLLAAADGAKVVIVSRWRDGDAVKAMQSDERMQAYFPKITALARFDSILTTVAHVRVA